eukprot:2450396-Heterocapsa_arctica.AAC.1
MSGRLADPGTFPRVWNKASQSARDRCDAERRLFPTNHYEEQVLLWHDQEWMRPNADHWEQLFGLPP